MSRTESMAATMGLNALALRSSRVRALIETGKPGITRLVAITAVVGFVLAALGQVWTFGLLASLASCVVGTVLSSLGANALNEWWERERDAKMARTAGRPIPRGELSAASVLGFGLGSSAAGVGLLLVVNGPGAALVALVCVLSYVLVYTPLKPLTVTSTLVGAIPGALPPLIGWAAASEAGSLASLTEPGGWSLVALMTIWQLPHFLAIAWMYRDDYAAGGFRVLPVVDPSGRATAITILVTAVLLVPATMLPVWAMPGLLGGATLVVALLTGLAYLWLAVKLAISRTRPAARRVFFASIIHLPVLLLVIVAEAVGRTLL